MSETVIEKPVYSTGQPLGAIISGNEAAATQPAPETTTTTVNTSGQLETPPTPPQEAVLPTTITPPAQEAPAIQPQTESVNFTFEVAPGTPPAEVVPPTVNAPATDWKATIKTLNRAEVLKELEFDDFAIELDAHRKAGGDVVDYLNAKSFDWNKVSDVDVMKGDLQKQFPTFSPQEIDRLFARKYGVPDTAEDEEKTDALLMLKADAHTKRQNYIQEQSKFKIPAAIPSQQTVVTQSQEQTEAANRQQLEAAVKYVSEHEAIKDLMTSKRVALNLGENGTFNFNIEQPDFLVRAIADPVAWGQLTLNKQGEPDIGKMSKIALYAANPELFETSLVNYGKTLGLKTLVEEGQNATRPARQLPGQTNQTEQEAWKTAKSGTVGGR